MPGPFPVPTKEELAEMCTVEQVKQLRQELETKVLALIKDFQARTNTTVTAVKLDTRRMATLGEKAVKQVVDGVTVQVEI